MTDVNAAIQTVATDANGDYSVTVPAGNTTLDVDETDVDFPSGHALSTSNDPQVVAATAGSTASAGDVGYEPVDLSVTKTSDATADGLDPGDTIIYTITIDNNGGSTIDDLLLDDPLPSGTSFVSSSYTVNPNDAIRVTEYFIGAGVFTGATHNLTLLQDLERNYFVVVQGSDGVGNTGTNTGPDENYVSITADPFPTGDLAASGSNDVLGLTRGAASSGSLAGWVGVVTVVEALGDLATAGFRLLDVQRVFHDGAAEGGGVTDLGPTQDTSAVNWSDINQVMLAGGFQGGGCDTAESLSNDTKLCHVRFEPIDPNIIEWTRSSSGTNPANWSDADSTVMVVEWGSEWLVQRNRVNAAVAGTDGAAAITDYANANLTTPVCRDNTFVWGTGFTSDNGIGDASEGVLITLGDGVNQAVCPATESMVSVGLEHSRTVDFEVYAITHVDGDLAVDYRFKVDGDSDILTLAVSVDDVAASTDTMALSYNGMEGTGPAYGRPIFSARYTNTDEITLERRRNDNAAQTFANFPAWVQGIDFGNVLIDEAAATPLTFPLPFSIAAGGQIVVTYQVLVDAPLGSTIGEITNTATVTADDAGGTPFDVIAGVTDPVRPLLSVDPNGGATVVNDDPSPGTLDAAQTVVFFHTVENTGTGDDTYDVTATSASGFQIELLSSDGATVIATDTNGDGTWDSVNAAFDTDTDGVPDTAVKAAGETEDYRLRVTVPAGTNVGDSDSVEFIATSSRITTQSASAFDEITVIEQIIDPGTGNDVAGDIVLSPDNSSSLESPAVDTTITYSHVLANNTGADDNFDIVAISDRGYVVELLDSASGVVIAIDSDGDGDWDSIDADGDGVFDPPGAVGTFNVDGNAFPDLAVTNGASGIVEIRITVPASEPDGSVDITSVTAFSVDDSSLSGSASDTTTISGASALDFELTGGGTHVVNPGDTDLFTGALLNLTTTALNESSFPVQNPQGDDEAVEITVSGTPNSADGFGHPTEFCVDSTGYNDEDAGDAAPDGTVDLCIAVDSNGDGDWDQVDVNGDGDFMDPGETQLETDIGVNFPVGIFNKDGNTTPDVSLEPFGDENGDDVREYEVNRDVDMSQSPYRDPITLTASVNPTKSVTVTTIVLLATLASIDSVAAYDSPDGVVLQWETGSELGTVGFIVQRRGLNQERFHRVNQKLLPGLLHARDGGTYRLLDPGAKPERFYDYRLVEVEAMGTRITHGPYRVYVHPDAASAGIEAGEPLSGGFDRARRPNEALAQRWAENRAAREAAAERRLARRGPVLKVFTAEAGLHFLDAEQIAQRMGITAHRVRELIGRGRIGLSNRGQPVATRTPSDRRGLYFYANAVGDGSERTVDQDRSDMQYTDENVYWVKIRRGLEMARHNGGSPAPVADLTFPAVATAEDNIYFLTFLFDDPDGDYWVWDYRVGGLDLPDCGPDLAPPACNFNELVLPSPGVRAEPGDTATLTVRLHGASDAPDGLTHVITVSLNGTEVGSAAWDGLQPHSATFEVDAALLVDGDNPVNVVAASSGDPFMPSVIYINDLELAYTRAYRALDDALEARVHGHDTVTIDGFEHQTVWVLDLADRHRPQFVIRKTVDETPDGFRVSFEPAPGAESFLAATPGSALSPVDVIADIPSELRRTAHQVDYLVITASDMVESAERLAAHRAAQGWRTMVVDVEDIYDEFNWGIHNADAIWSFLRYAQRQWRAAPRYVVLAGEGSLDYKDYLGHGDSVVPTLLAPTPEGLFPSDNLFADVAGNDGLPEMAVGRLPVITAEELDLVVDKLVAYDESGAEPDGPDWTRQVVVAADEPDLGGEFTETAEAIAEMFPPEYEVDRIYVDQAPPIISGSDCISHETCMIEALNLGRAFVSFAGHSNHTTVGNTNLIAGDDLALLTNADRLPVLTVLTCLAAQFGLPGEESIGEQLVIAPDRGAVAVWGPSGLSRNHRARVLGEAFYRATFPGDADTPGELLLGEAILSAQRAYAAQGEDLYLLDIYNLLGDPATVMR